MRSPSTAAGLSAGGAEQLRVYPLAGRAIGVAEIVAMLNAGDGATRPDLPAPRRS